MVTGRRVDRISSTTSISSPAGSKPNHPDVTTLAVPYTLIPLSLQLSVLDAMTTALRAQDVLRADETPTNVIGKNTDEHGEPVPGSPMRSLCVPPTRADQAHKGRKRHQAESGIYSRV